ncbi:MAG TPA: anti-sigma factor [Anaerolineales bacterium]
MFAETHVLDLLPAYALGSLDAEEAKHVEEHLSGCLICRAESHSFQEVAGQLSFAAPAAAPSPDLKERLIQRVQTASPRRAVPAQSPRRPWPERLLPVWGLASLGLIIALAAFSLSLWQRLNQLEFLTAPGGMRAMPLSATDEAPGATGFVLVSADGRNGAIVVDGLPPLDGDRQYQVWLIRDGERTSGAVFSTDEESYGGMRLQVAGSLLEYSDVGITVEPAGGSPQPTGVKVLGGPLFNP